jgi:hypothetical protein
MDCASRARVFIPSEGLSSTELVLADTRCDASVDATQGASEGCADSKDIDESLIRLDSLGSSRVTFDNCFFASLVMSRQEWMYAFALEKFK